LDDQDRARQERIERAEKGASFLMRLFVSMVLPLWGLAMLVLGIQSGSLWWIGCGLVVGGIGALMLAGSPLTDSILRGR
jgi:hypothetical protein